MGWILGKIERMADKEKTGRKEMRKKIEGW